MEGAFRVRSVAWDGPAAGGTTESPGRVLAARRPVAEISALGGDAVAAAGVARFLSGHRQLDGVGTTVRLDRGRGRGLTLPVGGSWKISVALRGVADETGSKRGDAGEARRHGVAVDVAGDKMVGE
jgi:hypothetical protein